MMSPISSLMTDRLGCRATALIGGSIASVGLFCSSFVNRIEWLYLTYGLFIGGGFSIGYTPSLVILGHYFKKRIGLANGIVATGSSIFTIALPFLIQYILDEFGLKLTLRYMTVITIVMTLGALVFTPLLEKEVKEIIDEKGVKVKKKSVVHRKQSVFNKVSPFKNVSPGIWKNKRYRIWAVGVPLALFGYFVPFFHLVGGFTIFISDCLVIFCLKFKGFFLLDCNLMALLTKLYHLHMIGNFAVSILCGA